MMATCELLEKREQAQVAWEEKTDAELYITIGTGTCGLAAGAQEALAAVEAEVEPARYDGGLRADRLRGDVLLRTDGRTASRGEDAGELWQRAGGEYPRNIRLLFRGGAAEEGGDRRACGSFRGREWDWQRSNR